MTSLKDSSIYELKKGFMKVKFTAFINNGVKFDSNIVYRGNLNNIVKQTLIFDDDGIEVIVICIMTSCDINGIIIKTGFPLGYTSRLADIYDHALSLKEILLKK